MHPTVKIILYLAVSADGFIADKDGSVSWLDEYASVEVPKGYSSQEFFDSVDALIIGKNTYEQMLTFGPWHHVGKTSYVFAGKNTLVTDNKDIEFVRTDVPEFMQYLATKNFKRVWLVGGAKLAETFYKHGLIDEYNIAFMPKKLEQGIPLLPEIVEGKGMTLVEEVTWPCGIVQKIYKKA